MNPHLQNILRDNSTAYGPGILDDVLEGINESAVQKSHSILRSDLFAEVPFDINELVLSQKPEMRYI
jgi:hypothetical protein